MQFVQLERVLRSAAAIAVIGTLAACSGGSNRLLPLTPGSIAEDGKEHGGAGLRWQRMAESAAMSGDRQTAIGLYQQILNRDETNDNAWYALGGLLLDAGNVRGSADAFAQVLKRKPGDRQASVGYARAMMALGRPEAAAAHVEPLLEDQADDLSLLNLLAVIRDLQGDHEGAQALYRRGLIVDPESIMLRNNMALSAALSGKYEGAIELMQPIVDGLASNRQTRQNYALIQGLAGNFAKAEQISLIDLDRQATANNIAYFSTLRAMAPSQARSAVLRPTMAGSSSLPLRERREAMVFGISANGSELALADTPNDSWFVNLGQFASKAEADAFWQETRTANPDLLARLHPLATGDDGPRQLTVGPLSGRAEADLVCNALPPKTPCQAIKL